MMNLYCCAFLEDRYYLYADNKQEAIMFASLIIDGDIIISYILSIIRDEFTIKKLDNEPWKTISGVRYCHVLR